MHLLPSLTLKPLNLPFQDVKKALIDCCFLLLFLLLLGCISTHAPFPSSNIFQLAFDVTILETSMLEICVNGLRGKDMFHTSTASSPSKPTERFLMPRPLFLGAISNSKSPKPLIETNTKERQYDVRFQLILHYVERLKRKNKKISTTSEMLKRANYNKAMARRDACRRWNNPSKV